MCQKFASNSLEIVPLLSGSKPASHQALSQPVALHMSTEVSHLDAIRLITAVSPALLWHTKSGEVVPLAQGEWSLAFHEHTAILHPVSSDLQPRWANDVLDLSYHVTSGGEEDEYFFHSKAKGESFHVVDSFIDMKVLAFVYSEERQGSWSSELYQHAYPIVDGCRHFWCMPWVQQEVFGSDLHNRFLCRRAAGSRRYSGAPQEKTKLVLT